MRHCQGELQTGCRTGPSEKSERQAPKLEGQRHLSSLTSDMERQDMEFVLLVFDLALIPYFFFHFAPYV